MPPIDVFYDVGDVFDVVARRAAPAPPAAAGPRDRVYARRRTASARVAPAAGGSAPGAGRLVLARRATTATARRSGTALVYVRRGAGDAYAITAGARGLRIARASERRRRGLARAGAGRARLGRGAARRLSAGVPGRRDACARGVARGGGGGAACVPWHVAREDPPVRPGALVRARERRRPARVRSVGLPARARCSCGAVAFCSRDCQRTGFDAHAAACSRTARRRQRRRRRRVGRRGRARRARGGSGRPFAAAAVAARRRDRHRTITARRRGRAARATTPGGGTTTAPPTTRTTGKRRLPPKRRRTTTLPPRTTKAAAGVPSVVFTPPAQV